MGNMETGTLEAVPNIRLLSGTILVRPDRPKENTKSGIILANYAPQSKYEREIYSNTGDVIMVSSSVSRVSVGDSILFYRFGAAEIYLDDIRYLILDEKDIIAKIEEKANGK